MYVAGFLLSAAMLLQYLSYSETQTAGDAPSPAAGDRDRDRDVITYYIHPSKYKSEMTSIIEDGKVWSKVCVFVEVGTPQHADFTIEVMSRAKIASLIKNPRPYEYYPKSKKRIYFSYTLDSRYIYIDEINWRYGVAESGLTLKDYRQYLLFHEIGHVLGYEHQPCKRDRCPIMYQMTRGPPAGYGRRGVDLTPVLGRE